MESIITLYECPPLRARLSAHQCALNRARAAAPPSPRRWHRSIADAVAAAPPRECESCRGVLWFAEQSGRGPHTLAKAELVRLHAQADERRRQTRAVPESTSYSLRMEDVAELLGLGGAR